MKLKKKKSLMSKKRYLVFKIHSDRPVSYEDAKNAALSSLLDWMGESGLAESGFRMIRNLWDQKLQTGWASCSVKSVDDVKISLALIHQIGDSRVIFQTLRVTGTIKSGKEKT